MYPKDRVQPAYFPRPVSPIHGEVQGFLGTDRLRKEPGLVPGSDQAGVRKRREDGTAGGAHLSPSPAARPAPRGPARLISPFNLPLDNSRLNNYRGGVPGRIATELKQATPMSLEAEALLNIHRTAGMLDAGMAEILKPLDLSSAQYNVLRILRGAGKAGLPCGEIGCRMVTRDPDITRLLDRLEKRGLIGRSREGKDRRVITVRITSAGLLAIKGLDSAVDRYVRNRFGKLGAERLRALIEALELVRAADYASGNEGAR